MTPLDRIRVEAQYLLDVSRYSGFSVSLRVSSQGASFSICDPVSDFEWFRSDAIETLTTAEFEQAVDTAVHAARLSRGSGVTFS